MMRLEDPAGEPAKDPAPLPAVAEQPVESLPPRRSHLVAIVARRLAAGETTEPGAAIREHYWNPHERRWVENDYESLEALRRRHIEEEGWELLQEQQLDAPDLVELIFKGHRIDFTRPSREQILRDIGMTPDDVSDLLGNVDRDEQGG
jgi:hypothetical protein